jgi:cell division protease FtsH
MSDKIGPLTFGKREEHIFLGREIARPKEYSESTAVDIDNEIKRIVLQNYERAKGIITQQVDRLHNLAKALLEKEVLAGEEIDQVLGLKHPPPESPPRDLVPAARAL